MAVPVVLLIIVLAAWGGNGGGGGSGNKALDDAGVQVDALGLWSYDVTCGQIRDHPDIIRPTAVELSEQLNSPLGKDEAIDAIADALPRACDGVSSDYSPGEDAFDMGRG